MVGHRIRGALSQECHGSESDALSGNGSGWVACARVRAMRYIAPCSGFVEGSGLASGGIDA